MKYLFDKWNSFAGALKKKKNVLLLLDFDGTLAPLMGRPDQAKLPPAVKRSLERLSKSRRIDIGIVSGRGLKDLMKLAGLKGIYYAGNHGLEIKSPKKLFIHPSSKKYRPYIKKIESTLRRGVSGIKGAIVEDKGICLSLHYRLVAAKDIPKLRSIFKDICAPYIKSGRIKVTTGKKIFEIRPPVPWHKGKAVKMIEKITRKKGGLKVFIGDDLTDEDAFKALKKTDFPIRVVRKKSSNARYYLKNPGEVERLIMKITKILASFFIIFSISASLCMPHSFAERPDIVIKELLGLGEVDAYQDPFKIKTDTYTTKTKDGWEISINRYQAEKEVYVEETKAAVILCHGFNINNTFWDLDGRSSLARYLAKSGYDVWAPSLRGSGLSSKPVLSRMRGLIKFDLKDIPRMFVKAPFDIAKFGWTIDDHIHEDVPAIIDFVKRGSGFDKVYWIGHSMGGIVMFGYLETETQDDIAGFIPLGSMMVIPRPLTPHLQKIANQKQILTASLIINTTAASQFRNFTFGVVKNPIEDLLFERKNMHDVVVVRFFRKSIDDTSAGVVGQFSDSIRNGSMISSDKSYNYSRNMSRIKVPVMIMGGSADGFVDEESLKDSYDMISSRDKKIVVFSKANGYSTDYGHCDLVLGKNSEQEVYPVILGWLDERTRERWWKKLPIMRQQ